MKRKEASPTSCPPSLDVDLRDPLIGSEEEFRSLFFFSLIFQGGDLLVNCWLRGGPVALVVSGMGAMGESDKSVNSELIK